MVSGAENTRDWSKSSVSMDYNLERLVDDSKVYFNSFAKKGISLILDLLHIQITQTW